MAKTTIKREKFRGGYYWTVRREGRVLERLKVSGGLKKANIIRRFKEKKSIKPGFERRVVGTHKQLYEIVMNEKEFRKKRFKTYERLGLQAGTREERQGFQATLSVIIDGELIHSRSRQYKSRRDLNRAKSEARENMIGQLASKFFGDDYEMAEFSKRQKLKAEAQKQLDQLTLKENFVTYEDKSD